MLKLNVIVFYPEIQRGTVASFFEFRGQLKWISEGTFCKL